MSRMTDYVRAPLVLGDFIPSPIHWALCCQKVEVIAPYLRAALAALDAGKPPALGGKSPTHAIIIDDIISEEESMQEPKIEADTSKYPMAPRDRILAAAECIKAQLAGKEVEVRDRHLPGAKWHLPGTGWACNSEDLDCRVKPEPVVTTKPVYVIRANIRLYSKTEYESRAEALERLRSLSGPAAIDTVLITYHDGKEVSRQVYEAVR